jgi:hypothetical protein
MVDIKALEAKICQDICQTLCTSHPETIAAHGRRLREITEHAQKSVFYRGKITAIESLEGLNSLPVTFFNSISESIKKNGLDKVLITKYAKYWQTSGYTGEPKRFYYSEGDVAWITRNFSMLGYILGIRPWMSGWNFGGRDPLLSASLFDLAAVELGITDILSTPLGSQEDFIRAIKLASRRDKYQITAGTPFLYLVLHRAAYEPGYAMGAIVRGAKLQYNMPTFIAKVIAWFFLRGINYENLRSIVNNAELGLSYAESTGPHIEKLKACFPKMRFIDGFGSTECPVQGIQLLGDRDDIAVALPSIIPEIAKPEDVQRVKKYDPGNGNGPPPLVEAVPWHRWTKGLRGELLITRPGECFPLVRYATGDLIEVIDPARHYKMRLENNEVEFVLPTIKILGRSVDLVDFEVPDEKGDYMGGRIYARQVQDALTSVPNVRWWEFYRVKGSPPRIVFLIIPETDVKNDAEFRSKITSKLMNLEAFLNVAFSLDLARVIVTKPAAYGCIEAEIDRRVKEGRALGQLKPRHITYVESEEELQRLISNKLGAR